MSSPKDFMNIGTTPEECIEEILEELQQPDLEPAEQAKLELQLELLQPQINKTAQTCMCNRRESEGPNPTCLKRNGADSCIWDNNLLPAHKYNKHFDAFNELGTHYYRVTDRSTGGDYPRAEVTIIAYPIDRQTDHWVWLKGKGPGVGPFEKEGIFKVGNKAQRSFAHHSIAAAIHSWRARKSSQLWHLRNKLDHVERAMELVTKTNWSPVEATKARYK